MAKSDYQLCDVCPSTRSYVRLEQLGYHSTEFHDIWYLNIFRKSAQKFEVAIKSDKHNRYII